jgi:hypothetical protein
MPSSHDHLRLRRPLLVDVTREDDIFLVSHLATRAYGAGIDLQDAVDMFLDDLFERYETCSQAAALGPDLAIEYEQLKQIVEVTRHADEVA